ncbi:hydroxymethylglutaryl-CoA lyase [Bacillota bacterium]
MMAYNNQRIEVVEVGPRDGFQNIVDFIPTDIKLSIINGLFESGIDRMQCGSFISPKAIPQMQDSKIIIQECLSKYPHKQILALVPNMYGANTANEIGLKNIACVVSLSESHNKANINRTRSESLNEISNIVNKYPEMKVAADLATAFGCPFEGKFSTETVVDFIRQLNDAGIKEITLCDTIGIANPRQTEEIVQAVLETFPSITIGVHFHDTRNMGIACSLKAIENGVSIVQTTLGGLGGCPFAPGASGNTSTEDLVYMLNDMGYETGIDFPMLLETARRQKGLISRGNYSSHHINI